MKNERLLERSLRWLECHYRNIENSFFTSRDNMATKYCP